MRRNWTFAIFALFVLACQTDETKNTENNNIPVGSNGPPGATQEDKKMSVYDFKMQTIAGQEVLLKQYEGKALLFVNVASECGFTHQYEGLQKLWEKHRDNGLVVLGFPSNDFGAQEPGSNEEILAFCESKFGVSFPMFSKISVKGPEKHPLYAYLTEETGEEIGWNFNKILVDRHGSVTRHFPAQTEPLSEEFQSALRDLL